MSDFELTPSPNGAELALTQPQKPMAGSGVDEMYARDRAEKLNRGLRIRREANAIVVNGILRLRVIVGDNIMILEDEFKSSYDCRTCQGAGKLRSNCLKCDSTGKLDAKGMALPKEAHDFVVCGLCDGFGYKDIDCSACNGKGAIVEIPKEQRKKPTSGTIVSIGPDVKIYKVSDRVCYSNYIGNFLPFNDQDRIKIMREHEAMCLLEDVDPNYPSVDHVEFSSSDNPYDGIVTTA